MKADVDKDGYLRIDAQTLVRSLPDDVLRTVAKYALFDELVLNGIIGALVDGMMWSCDEEGPWWFSEPTFTKLRLKLLPLLPAITIEAVRQLESDLRHEKADRQRWNDAAWKLWHAWPVGTERRQHPSPPFEYRTPLTKAEAEAHLRALEATPRMTREQAVEIARRCARTKPQSYYTEPFEPHEWVVDAILAAAGGSNA